MDASAPTWYANKKARRLVRLGYLALFVGGTVGVLVVAPAAGVPLWGILAGLSIFVPVSLLLEMFVPSRIGFAGDFVLLNRFYRLTTKRIRVSDMVGVKYNLSARDLKKSEENRLYNLVVSLRDGRRVQFGCEGSIAQRIMQILPRERSRLAIYSGRRLLEERPLR